MGGRGWGRGSPWCVIYVVGEFAGFGRSEASSLKLAMGVVTGMGMGFWRIHIYGLLSVQGSFWGLCHVMTRLRARVGAGRFWWWIVWVDEAIYDRDPARTTSCFLVNEIEHMYTKHIEPYQLVNP